MNGLVFLASLVIAGIIAWLLLERFAPEKAAGFKTWALNLVMGLPVIGPELANQLLGFNFGQFIAQDKLVWYFGALVVLNLFGRMRTNTPFGGGSSSRDIDWDVR